MRFCNKGKRCYRGVLLLIGMICTIAKKMRKFFMFKLGLYEMASYIQNKSLKKMQIFYVNKYRSIQHSPARMLQANTRFG